MLKWRHFIHSGCVGKGTQDSNHIVALNQLLFHMIMIIIIIIYPR